MRVQKMNEYIATCKTLITRIVFTSTEFCTFMHYIQFSGKAKPSTCSVKDPSHPCGVEALSSSNWTFSCNHKGSKGEKNVKLMKITFASPLLFGKKKKKKEKDAFT